MATNTNPPLPTPPFYTIPNICNLRDAALSVTTSSGSKLRPNTLFRSADVSKLEVENWRALYALGVAHVFDLRSKPEVDKSLAAGNKHGDESKTWMGKMGQAGVKRSWVPVFQETDYSPEKIAVRFAKYMDEDVQGFVTAYRGILDEAGPAFASIFRYLANLPAPEQEGRVQGKEGHKLGALIHCTAGKDRTGLFFAVLFAFLDVPFDQIATEYNLTELGLQPIRDETADRLLNTLAFQTYMKAQMAVDDPESMEGAGTINFSPEVQEKGRQAALRMISARKESMMGSLEMLNTEFGGARNYMKVRCGLDDDILERLRKNLVVVDDEAKIGPKV